MKSCQLLAEEVLGVVLDYGRLEVLIQTPNGLKGKVEEPYSSLSVEICVQHSDLNVDCFSFGDSLIIS